MLNLQLNQEIPSYCQVHRAYASATEHQEKARWITEFHLETLCREVILHAGEIGQPKDTLRNWKALAKAINCLKELEEAIAKTYITPGLLLQEMHRMAHRQFPWREFQPSAANITRYYMIYGRSPLSAVIRSSTGLSVEELFLFGMALLGTFMDKYALYCPPQIEIPTLSFDGLERFLRHFSRDLGVLRKCLQDEHEMNDRFSYAYHSLRAFPIIKTVIQGRESLICPAPTLLFWRFTSGVYYEIFKEQGFENAFGEAFQWYVGQVLEKGTDRNRTRLIPETQYWVGKDLKRTVDWIMEQDGAALFIEAKTKRMAFEAKVEIGQGDILFSELDKMARMVVQVYKSIRDYRASAYPNYTFDPQRKIYPLIVTLEDWFLMGPKLLGELNRNVFERMQKEGLPSSFVRDMPFTVCSIQEFEHAVQVMDLAGINTFMQGKVDSSKSDWTLGAYLRDGYKGFAKDIRFLFNDEFESIGIRAIESYIAPTRQA